MHKTDNRMSDYHFRATANYNRTFDNRHTVNLFGGMETTDIDRTRTRFEGWGLQYESGEAPSTPTSNFKKSIEEGNDYYQLVNSNWRTVAFYGNATYSYRGRYVVNGTYRYEGSNQLGRNTDARWMSTWNLSGAWNIHEERWFAKLAPLSHLTLRTSYSLTGTPPDPSLVSSTTIFRNSTPYRLFASDQESGLAITELGNALLTYEKKNEFNVGIDAGLWNNRINATLDVYTRNNYDEIGPMVTQGMSGQIVNWGNVAEMKSNGVEVSLTSTNLKQKDFSWTTSFVFSYTNTEITKLFNNGRVIDLVSGNGFAMKGFPARALFSVPFLGLNDAGIPPLPQREGRDHDRRHQLPRTQQHRLPEIWRADGSEVRGLAGQHAFLQRFPPECVLDLLVWRRSALGSEIPHALYRHDFDDADVPQPLDGPRRRESDGCARHLEQTPVHAKPPTALCLQCLQLLVGAHGQV